MSKAKYSIIPKPQKYDVLDGTYIVTPETEVLCYPEFMKAGKYISNFLRTKKDAKNGFIKFIKDEKIPSEGYKLKITPEGITISSSENIYDVSVSLDCSYFAVFGDDPYKDDPYKNKEMCIKFLSSEVIHEIFCDLCLADCLQKRDEILYDIRQNLTTKVLQRFPDIEFQVLNITMVFDLNS